MHKESFTPLSYTIYTVVPKEAPKQAFLNGLELTGSQSTVILIVSQGRKKPAIWTMEPEVAKQRILLSFPLWIVTQ